ncbi:hypothetical protein VitviT2T_028872 [Vitis vinifera]|uniref:Patellin-5 n=2 Tax=Vitis vinifera TaxID=29760 RepID=F6I407_VITVI|nr:patellin-3 [Vitis vinifera]RVW95660.1 Patellin-5 [Vitis vinifera]WKA11366.1 hypothetical protein VitviT2T_028872 [Vitis vinifera]|eukprot:XP_002267428.1 PREDICTED: patellin-3 [Vitis vinifera]
MAEDGKKPVSEEAQKPVAEASVVEEVVAVAEVTAPPPAVPEAEEAAEKLKEEEEVVEKLEEEVAAAEEEKPKVVEEGEKMTESVSFKEESNVVGDLPESQRKALEELKVLVREALEKHEFTAPPPPPPPPAKEEEKAPATEEEPKTEAPAEPAPEVVCPPPVEESEKKEEKEEEKKEEEKKEEEKKEEEKVAPPEPAEPVVVAAVVETVTAVVVDEDGTKTVEAIEETIVVAPPAPPAEEAAAVVEEVTPPPPAEEVPPPPPPPPEEVEIWGIKLFDDDRTDVVLLKFLRARDFKPKEALTMLKNTVLWRKSFGIETLLGDDLGTHLESVVFMEGSGKEGHPVCYNAYGKFLNKELYQNTFSDEEKRQNFLRWRIQFLEKSIRKLDFSPNGINTIIQVNDLKNSPGPFKRELRQSTNQALHLLQDNYPEFVAKQIFINVPWWYLAFNRMISPFLTQRTKSKFVFAGPSKSAETLFKYIAPEQVPVQYGGLKRDGDTEFSICDPVTLVTIKPGCKHVIEFPYSEPCQLIWELRVIGWDVTYGAEFVPTVEGGYTVIVQKARKIAPTDEPVISNSFKIGEPGKVILTIDNQTSKKKKLLYRSKTQPCD